MPHLVRRFFALTAIAFLGSIGVAGQARGEFLTALGRTAGSDNFLYSFDSNSPGNVTGVAVSGLGAGVSILSIDYRPANGTLYGLGNDNRLYTINATTGVATQGSLLSTSPIAAGVQYGIDFNPTVDRLRIVGSNNQNLRINVDTGAVTTDTALNGAMNVVAAAYTNSFPGAITTTLFDLNYVQGTTGAPSVFNLNTQAPPNDGVLTPVGSTGISSPSSLVGFDISGSTGIAYVASNTTTGIAGNSAILSQISLTTGNVIAFAPIDGPGFQVRGLSVVPSAVPEPASVVMVGAGLIGLGGLALRRRKASTR